MCDLTHQTRCSLQLQSLLGEGQELSPSPCCLPHCRVTCVFNHRGQQLILKDGSCHEIWTTHSHTVLCHRAPWHPNYQQFILPTRYLFSRKAEKTKNTYQRRAEILLSAACAIFLVKLHTQLLLLIFQEQFFLCLA